MWNLFLVAILTVFAARTSACDSESCLHSGNRINGEAREPRLIALPTQLEVVRNNLATDPHLQHWYNTLSRSAARMMQQKVFRAPSLATGQQGLDKSRKLVNELVILSGLYLIDQDIAKAERVRQLALNIVDLDDWNPEHLLTVAELAFGMSLAYDWIYSYLSPTERNQLEQALINKAILPSNRCQGLVANNWMHVCNGAIGVAALAIAPQHPDLATSTLANSVTNLRTTFARLAPDGAWYEGLNYWTYSLNYSLQFIAAAQTAMGEDFGLASLPGVRETVQYFSHMIGPTNLPFNFGDSWGIVLPNFLAWHAREYRSEHSMREALVWSQRQAANKDWAFIFYLLQYEVPPVSAGIELLPRARVFHGIVDVAALRGDWIDQEAAYIAIKGGKPDGSHNHYDGGTFVLDWMGQRWAMDLGGDDYGLPGYFGPQRPSYYRIKSEGQNTLILSEQPLTPFEMPNHNAQNTLPIVNFTDSPQLATVTVNLTRAFLPSLVAESKRSVSLIKDEEIAITDQIFVHRSAYATWIMHTDADVKVNSATSIELTKNSKRLSVTSAPGMGSFRVISANPRTHNHNSQENPNTSVKRLVLESRLSPGLNQLDVRFRKFTSRQ